MKLDVVIQGDCLEVMPTLEAKSVPLIIADPPYGMNMAHWDKVVDVEAVVCAISRVMAEDGFFVLFGMMPTVLDWLVCLEKSGFSYREHISWVKRHVMPSCRLSRGHESIFIYSKNNAKFYDTKGPYEDVKLPGLMFDTVTIEAIKRYISGLWTTIRTGKNEYRKGGTNGYPAYARLKSSTERSPRNVNFTNVWSFVPENKKHFGDGTNINHPTVKPVDLYLRLVEMLSQKNDLILAPFAGSGTAAIACMRSNRRYLCIEREAEYVDIANERIRQEQAQLKLDLS